MHGHTALPVASSKVNTDFTQSRLDGFILLPQRRGFCLALKNEFSIMTQLVFKLFLVVGLALAVAYLRAANLRAASLVLCLISYTLSA